MLNYADRKGRAALALAVAFAFAFALGSGSCRLQADRPFGIEGIKVKEYKNQVTGAVSWGVSWVLPPLSNSWIIIIIWLFTYSP